MDILLFVLIVVLDFSVLYNVNQQQTSKMERFLSYLLILLLPILGITIYYCILYIKRK